MIPQVFRDVDILGSLEHVVDQHTKHYKDDFIIDRNIICKLADSPDETDRHLIWLCRPLGTHIMRERDIYLEGTHENKCFSFYHDQTRDNVLAYAIHLKNREGFDVTGDIYQLDYAAEIERAKLLTCPVYRVTLFFPDDTEFTVPYRTYRGYLNELSQKHGDLKAMRYEPESEAELGVILRRQWSRRDRQANLGDIAEHFDGLNKSSVRDKLQEAKAGIKASEHKAIKKDEQAL